MSLIDFILNLAGLLLWLNGRSARLDPLVQSSPSPLLGTLKRAEPSRMKGWQFLAGLVVLLVLRGWFYWAVGSPTDWTPKLNLAVVVLAFPSEKWWADLLFSVLSFIRVLLVFYFWLIVVLCLKTPTDEPEPIRRLLRLHLGHLARWPWPFQVLLPPLLASALWLSLHWLLVRLGVTNRPGSLLHLVEQALLIALWMVFSLKYLLPPFLVLYLVASYVYLGGGPLWEFISSVAHGLLAPLQNLPLRFARLDLSPVAGVLLLLLLLDRLPNYVLRELARRHVNLWPQ